jgi:hypothetical protein
MVSGFKRARHREIVSLPPEKTRSTAAAEPVTAYQDQLTSRVRGKVRRGVGQEQIQPLHISAESINQAAKIQHLWQHVDALTGTHSERSILSRSTSFLCRQELRDEIQSKIANNVKGM